MASIAAFPQERIVSRTPGDAVASKSSGDLKAELESDEDCRQRGRVNLFAAVTVIVLIAAGWWLVNSLVETQKVQGCYASGTRYCSLI